MSVHVTDDVILLDGECAVEDAEPLLAALLNHPGHQIDVTGLTRAHLAVVQLLLAATRAMRGLPDNAFLRALGLSGVARSADKVDTG